MNFQMYYFISCLMKKKQIKELLINVNAILDPIVTFSIQSFLST